MINSNGTGGAFFEGVPLGFGMALAMNEKALNSYAKLTEAEKEEVIKQSRGARSKAEMEHIVNSIAERESTAG